MRAWLVAMALASAAVPAGVASAEACVWVNTTPTCVAEVPGHVCVHVGSDGGNPCNVQPPDPPDPPPGGGGIPDPCCIILPI